MFKFEENKSYRMPPYFGGNDFIPDFELFNNDVTAIKITYTTDEKKLADFLPEGFELLRPELSIVYNQLRETEFLFGGGYNLVQVQVPVRFNGKSDKLEGSFPLVIWENHNRPIVGGREESGQPKIIADINDLRVFKNRYYTNASYDGNTFLRMEMDKPQPVDSQVLDKVKEGYANYNVFGWRYIPKVGAPGADLSQPILYPQSMNVKNAWMGGGSFQWLKIPTIYQYVSIAPPYTDVPSQYEIVRQLSELPVYSTEPIMMVSGVLVMKPYMGRVME